MTNNVTAASAASTALAALGNLKAGLANVTQAVRAPGGDPILKMGRDGVWSYGVDNTEVEEGSEWAVNPLSIRFGYVCWKVIPQGSKASPELYGKHTRLMNQPALDPMGLQAKDGDGNDVDHSKHPWKEWIGFDIQCVSGEDDGTQCPYEPSSVGGIRAVRDLIAKISAQYDKDPEHCVPVLTLDSDSYPNKTYGGDTYYPVFNIVRWVGLDGLADEAPAEEPKPEPEKAPAATTTRRGRQAAAPTEPANDDQTADAAPAAASGEVGERRRRRR